MTSTFRAAGPARNPRRHDSRTFASHTFARYNRGVFKTITSQRYGAKNAIPTTPTASEFKLSDEDIAEIDYCFAGLKPYLQQS